MQSFDASCTSPACFDCWFFYNSLLGLSRGHVRAVSLPPLGFACADGLLQMSVCQGLIWSQRFPNGAISMTTFFIPWCPNLAFYPGVSRSQLLSQAHTCHCVPDSLLLLLGKIWNWHQLRAFIFCLNCFGAYSDSLFEASDANKLSMPMATQTRSTCDSSIPPDTGPSQKQE